MQLSCVWSQDISILCFFIHKQLLLEQIVTDGSPSAPHSSPRKRGKAGREYGYLSFTETPEKLHTQFLLTFQ